MPSKILTNNQIKVLKTIGADKYLPRRFYLTGGTALAGFYLHHRYSEDLDFFSEDEVDTLALSAFFKKHQDQLGVKKIDLEQSFNRNLFFLELEEETLKTEFTYFPFLRVETGRTAYGVEIDSLLDIAVNKLFSIYQRTAARDYVDFYFICEAEKLTVKELAKLARSKFDYEIDPLQLGTQFVKVKEVKDLPRMIKALDEDKLYKFFETEAKKLKPDIVG